jgi:GDP-L-fucose synthase
MKVVITGARGMLASAVRAQWAVLRPDDEVIGLSRTEVDLRDRDATLAVLEQIKPDLIVHCAATVGGIAANIAHPTAFLSDNLLLDTSVIGGAMAVGVKNLIYTGSSCMYPRDYRQPLVESDLLAAPLEPTNEGYAIAKIAGSKLCEYASREFGVTYRTIIPSNLYGPKDDVEDLAAWLVRSVESMSEWPAMMNVGCGDDRSVTELYEIARQVVGYDGDFVFDTTKPAGMLQKLMDSAVARSFGWEPETDLAAGMARAYDVYLSDSTPNA